MMMNFFQKVISPKCETNKSEVGMLGMLHVEASCNPKVQPNPKIWVDGWMISHEPHTKVDLMSNHIHPTKDSEKKCFRLSSSLKSLIELLLLLLSLSLFVKLIFLRASFN
jgi:hypothetical protein